ncbi:MAG: 50S ribosomal protein L24 [Planctomycetia bacterium]|nr:50S ribosomal protein L24 [Planctomycetia bacterium]
MRIKVNDKVVVLQGKDRGKQGQVTKVDAENSKVTVSGVNEVKKHVRPSQRNMQGGRLSLNMPVPASKVMLVCPSCNKPTRVGYKFTETVAEGKKARHSKVRICKKCGAVLPEPKYEKTR